MDSFLNNLVPLSDKFKVKRLRLEQKNLNLEHAKVKKLIEIAKPIDLNRIVTGKLQESSGDYGQDKKRKMMLPLFGKRNKLSNTFGIRGSNIKAEKDTDTLAESKNSEPGKASDSTEGNNDKKTISKTARQSIATVSAEKSKRSSEPSIQASDGRSAKKRSITGVTETSQPSKAKESESKAEEQEADEEGTEATSSSRKKRPRNRTRGKVRDNVDIDDAEELASEEKNVEWVPPSGQTGDGRTSLNEKYGY